MLKIYNLKDKQRYIKEIAILTQNEWGQRGLSDEQFRHKIESRISNMKSKLNNREYCKLILLDDDNLAGFISIFPEDCDERQDLSPWYATMFVKEEYRGKGYSRILNDAIIGEARKRNINRLYLKTDLEGYYEKFGAIYMETLISGEKLYYIDIPLNRIQIIGGSGSGKSTLASILSKELNLPAVYLDSINYEANWVEVDKEERDNKIIQEAKNEKWIMEGNYNQTLKNRLDRADLVIWLDYSTFAHIKGVFKRITHNFNKEKKEIPGCKECINLPFFKYVITYNRKKRPVVVELLQGIPDNKKLIFKKQKDLNMWLKEYINNKEE